MASAGDCATPVFLRRWWLDEPWARVEKSPVAGFGADQVHSRWTMPALLAIRGSAGIAETSGDDGATNGAGVAAGGALASSCAGVLKGATSSAQTVPTGGRARSMT